MEAEPPYLGLLTLIPPIPMEENTLLNAWLMRASIISLISSAVSRRRFWESRTLLSCVSMTDPGVLRFLSCLRQLPSGLYATHFRKERDPLPHSSSFSFMLSCRKTFLVN